MGSALFPLRMAHTKEDVFPQLATDCDRLDKLARLIILRKGLILQFEESGYSIDWLDSHQVEHGVAHQDFRILIDKVSEDSLLSLCPISGEIQ